MPGIMILDAEIALYTPTNHYWVVDGAWAGANPRPATAKACGPSALHSCELLEGQQIALCGAVNCEALCGASPVSPLCQGCLSNRAACIERVTQDYADCGVCPAGLTCRGDVVSTFSPNAGFDYCCGGNLVPCDGNCVSTACGAREQFSTATCRCECAPPYERGASGACECPPVACPQSLPVLGPNCNCGPCPAPLAACNGDCVDLQTDRYNCGTCGNTCFLGEDCCAGACTPLYSGGRCGSCALSCAGANHACCTAGFGGKGATCRNLAIDPKNCGACWQECAHYPGMICANGQCVCKPGYLSCGEGCCGPGWTCMASPSDKGSLCGCTAGQGCGPDDETCCPTGTHCCGGDTCCPIGKCCGGQTCCPAGKECCNNKTCCPTGTCCGNYCLTAGQTCCNGVPTKLGTPTDCAACGDACEYFWSDAPNTPVLGSCDTLHRCRCPAGSVATEWDSGGDTFCCPAAAPHECADKMHCGMGPC